MIVKRSSIVNIWFIFVSACLFQFPVSHAGAQTDDLSRLKSISASFENLSEKTNRSVVKIFATGYTVSTNVNQGLPAISREYHSGSGAILNKQGYIITNAHVVAGADRVRVLLPRKKDTNNPQRSILRPGGIMIEAAIVGQDTETDLAVLKIEASDLPVLAFGDSDQLRQGQLVFAFGSPRGLENSVSMGIISSTARQFSPEDPMIFLQTDASINPGNSGGPLVDAEGKLIGVNTFIISQSGGNEGIGFAVPSNIVKNIYEQIVKNGVVRRGEIGVNAQTITSELAAGLGLPKDWGVILGDVYPGGPADRAGLKVGDIILKLNNKVMENGRQFDVNLYNRAIGEVVTLEFQRGGSVLLQPVIVTQKEDDPRRFFEMVSPDKNLVSRLGVLAVDFYPEILQMLPVIRKQSGVVVASVDPGSPAAIAGLVPGDVIHSVNNADITSIIELRTKLGNIKPGGTAILQIAHQGELMFVPVEF